MTLFFPSQVRPTEGFGGWIGLLAQLLGFVRPIGHQVRRVCSLVVLSGCTWPEKRSGTRRRVFLFSPIASSASSLSFDYFIRARARDATRRHDVRGGDGRDLDRDRDVRRSRPDGAVWSLGGSLSRPSSPHAT